MKGTGHKGTGHKVARTIGKVVLGVLKTVLVVVMVVLLVLGNTLLPHYARMADDVLGYKQSWDNSKVSTAGLDLQYSKGDYSTTDEYNAAKKEFDKQLSAEGYVLLKNDDNAMPFSAGTTFSFFGESSDAIGDVSTAFANEGLSVNATLMKYYTSGAGKSYKLGTGSIGFGASEDFSINECPLSKLQSESGLLDSTKGTVPVFVFKRVAGEGRDMPRSMYTETSNQLDQSKSYLEPNSDELAILQYLNDNFDDAVLLVNTANPVELDWVSQFPHIKSIVYVPSFGVSGPAALAGIFSGSINPSGKTVDTFASDALASPAAQNYGDYGYFDEQGNDTGCSFASYEEGIYVGYRYYETRYEDKVLSQGNAGDFSYANEVVYPFGSGLSYTTFAWSGYQASWNGTTCTAKVTVTNTGSVAGKDVVELYAQSPYTSYDQANGIEKSAVELVGFEKTGELAPGASETVAITFDQDQLKAYDSTTAKTYVLDAGTYYVTAATDAHAAENNILVAKGKTVSDGMTAAGDTTFVSTYVPANATVDTTTYATDSYSGAAITNQFDATKGDATYITRANWTGTFPTHDGTASSTVSTWGNEINGTDADGNPAAYRYRKTASSSLLASIASTNSLNPTSDSSITDTPIYGAKNGLTLIEMRGLDYDDPQWDSLLDQLTASDYSTIVSSSGYGTPYLTSVGKPFGLDADTAAGLIYGGANGIGGMSSRFAGSMTLAQTYDTELAERYGEMIGNDAAFGQTTGWYAPSMNIHRTAFGGRNNEYYSEDGFVSGAIASQEVIGAASKGVYSTIKHFALNDQEDHRGDNNDGGMVTWANEQSIRELYLTPFEMCMKAGTVTENYVTKDATGSYVNANRQIRACQGVMTSFNRVGTTWAGGNYNLITGILRDEWSFDGFVITDSSAGGGKAMDTLQMMKAGGDGKLQYVPDTTYSYDQNSSVDYHYAREAAHHLLYTVANAKVMNGAMPGSVYVPGLETTTIVRYAINIGCPIVLALVGFFEGRRFLRWRKRRAEAKAGAAAGNGAGNGSVDGETGEAAE